MKVRTALVLLILLLVVPRETRSQPDWVKQTLEKPPPQVDKRSSSVILHHFRSIEIGPSGAHTEVRFAVRVLNTEGKAAATVIEATGPDRKIDNLKGWLYHSDGSSEKLPRDGWLEVGRTGAYYTDSRFLMARFVAARVGDVAAFE